MVEFQPMDPEARRLVTMFTRNLDRANPQSADWERFSEFILYAYRHAPQTSDAVGHALVQDAVGHALVQDGLDWEEAEPFVLFHQHATRLLEREAAAQARKAGATTRVTSPRKPRPRKRRTKTGRRKRRG